MFSFKCNSWTCEVINQIFLLRYKFSDFMFAAKMYTKSSKKCYKSIVWKIFLKRGVFAGCLGWMDWMELGVSCIYPVSFMEVSEVWRLWKTRMGSLERMKSPIFPNIPLPSSQNKIHKLKFFQQQQLFRIFHFSFSFFSSVVHIIA